MKDTEIFDRYCQFCYGETPAVPRYRFWFKDNASFDRHLRENHDCTLKEYKQARRSCCAQPGCLKPLLPGCPYCIDCARSTRTKLSYLNDHDRLQITMLDEFLQRFRPRNMSADEIKELQEKSEKEVAKAWRSASFNSKELEEEIAMLEEWEQESRKPWWRFW